MVPRVRRLLAAVCLATVLPALAIAAEPPRVVASVAPVHSIVAAVMEGVGEPVLLMDGATSPHGAALRPAQARAVQEAGVVFWVGPALEAFLRKPLSNLPEGRAVTLMDAPGLTYREPALAAMKEGHDDHDHDHDHEGEAKGDAHIWLDPANGIAMARQAAESLAKADPARADTYRANADAYAKRLMETQAAMKAKLAPVREKGFVVFHDAYAHFAGAMELRIADVVTVSPDTPMSAARLASVRRELGAREGTCAFAEPQFPDRVVQQAVSGTGALTGVLDPLGAKLEAGPDLYPNLLRNMADAIAACLSKTG